MLELICAAGKVVEAVPGQIAYTTAGTFSWVVPDGVKSICAVCIGAGSAVEVSSSLYAGMGGALRWSNNIPVTPGETLTIVTGAASAYIGYPAGAVGYGKGNDTYIARGATRLILAAGGRQDKATQIADSIGAGGGNGGARVVNAALNNGMCGTGAGGYSGDGGGGAANASPTDPTAGKAGGIGSNTINGQTVSSGGVGTGARLLGDSVLTGTTFGGGGASGRRSSDNGKAYSPGGIGGCRIIWGTDRSYPTNALDVTA